LVERTRLALGSLLQNPSPRGLHQKPPTVTPKRSGRALVPLASRTKHDLSSLADSRPRSRPKTLTKAARRRPSHEVWRPSSVRGNEQRPTPELPTPAAQHLQAFSASWRVPPLETLPALFHAGDAHGLSTFRGFPPPVADIASPQARERARFTTTPLLRAVPPTARAAGSEEPMTSATDRGFEDVSIRRIRSLGPVLPGDPRADPLLAFPLRGLGPSGLGPVLPRVLLSWAST
jgi:hypothetical protein